MSTAETDKITAKAETKNTKDNTKCAVELKFWNERCKNGRKNVINLLSTVLKAQIR